MKKLFLSFLLSAIVAITYGQTNFVVMGQINYYGTSNGVGLLPYTITVIDSNTTITHNAVTDVSGGFYDTISITSIIGQYPVILSYEDCDSTIVSDTIYTNPGNWMFTFPTQYYCTPTSGSCDASFTTFVSGDTLVTHALTNSYDSNYTITWVLPNGNTATGDSVSYVINNTYGSYTACVAVASSLFSCVDSSCQSFNAGIIPAPPIGGTITYSGSNVQSAMVYLIDVSNSSAGVILVAVDSTMTAQGNYSFTNVAPGNYFVKAALLTSDSSYSDYLPSYYANSTSGVGELHWTNAATITVSQGNSVTASFELVAGTNTGGPGFIGGLVSQGANKTNAEGDPVQGALVLLLDDNDNPVAYTISDASGAFEFSNLALGTYKVYTEVPGIPTTPGVVTLTQSETSTDLVRVEVNSSHVDTYIDNTSGIAGVNSHPFQLYPNPATDEFTLVPSSNDLGQTAYVSIYNMNGSLMSNTLVTLSQSNKFDISNLDQGCYLVQIQTNTSSTTVRLIK